MLKRLRSLVRVLTFRRNFEDGMTEELRFHMEQYADDLDKEVTLWAKVVKESGAKAN